MAAQIADKIFLDDELKDLYTNPLELYWTLTGKKRPAFCPFEGCKRGYIATWAIHDQQLFLTSIEGEVRRSFVLFGPKTRMYTLKRLFSRAEQHGVKAKWYSGRLRIPIGSMTRFDDHDYDSRFEQDIIITVEQGHVVRTVTLNNSEHALIIHETSAVPG
jgi:hypothetical protein